MAHFFGEPLLHPNIYTMIDLAEEAGIRVGISTNATCLTEEASYALLASRQLRRMLARFAFGPDRYDLPTVRFQ